MIYLDRNRFGAFGWSRFSLVDPVWRGVEFKALGLLERQLCIQLEKGSVGILALSTCTNITCSGTYAVLKLVVVFISK